MTGFRRFIHWPASLGRWIHTIYRSGAWLLAFGGWAALSAAEVTEAQHDLQVGNYADAVKAAAAVLDTTPGNTDASLLLIQAQLAMGHNVDAYLALAAALNRDNQSIRLRWIARDVAFANGHPEEAAKRVEEIRRLVAANSYNYRSPPDLVVFGRAALALGADPKDVLERVFATAQKGEPKLKDVYQARGDLALAKHDFALAARAFEEGLKQIPDDPDLLCGRAQSYASGDREVALTTLKEALKVNSRHVPSLLELASHHIDAEEYAQAATVLDNIVAINPTQPEAWAYRAVLAHLRNDAVAEKLARETGLSTWSRNPRVDFLIGEKLAQKYRFAEAAAYQRQAREFDPSYLPATAQLANDLLRLGEETEGWALAQTVHERDEYDVEAFNLVTLRDTMAKYATMTNDDFVVRMAAPEVAVYGPRVLALLRKAHQALTEKYGVELMKPTYVEIFADQKDFAVRTFGLPDIPGFLGVCFGRVVTANSPATSTSATNWEAVLWHEFCHVVTLQLTKNKMPRWLSEGISVYEEWQADPAWGMRIDSRYRAMVLGEDLVPVGRLSAAFLAPKTPNHLQFAYLESALVVQFIVERHGLESLRRVLRELRDGAEINAALAKHTVALPVLEKEFTAYVREQAGLVGKDLNWEKPDPELLQPENALDLLVWEQKHPDNYWLLRHRGQQLVELKLPEQAKVPLQRMLQLYPEQKGGDAAYRSLVAALRQLNDREGEKAALRHWIEVDDEAPDAYLRMMELGAADRDWTAVTRSANRYLAVNPLVAPPYRYQARASTEIGDLPAGILAWRTLLQLDVPDKSDVHFQLAKLLHQRGENGEARRQTLYSLEETPRYRDALRLLVELQKADGAGAADGSSKLPDAPAPAGPKAVLPKAGRP